jgi:PKD repeat protein
VSSAERHVLVDFPDDAQDLAVISTLDDFTSTSSHLYTWQLNTQNRYAHISVEGGLPTFTLQGEDNAYLKGWVLGAAAIDLQASVNIRASLQASNLKLWVVMAMGRGSAPVAEVSGSGLSAQLQVANRVLSYNSANNRIELTRQSDGPIARFQANSLSGVSPHNVHVDASTSSGTGLTYAWDFGDGTSASGITATHSYHGRADRPITLTVTDTQNRSDQASQLIRVTNTPPAAAFSASPQTGDLPLSVAFDASSSTDPDGHNLSYAWDFGDGSTGSGMTPTHVYTQRGLFYPVLTVSDGHGDSTISVAEIKAGNQDPTASVVATPLRGLPPLQVTLDGSNSYDPEGGLLSYEWDFGDGASATGANAVHTFTDYGVYPVTLVVTDAQGNTGEQRTEIHVENRPPAARIALSDYAGNAPALVHFDATGSTDPENGSLNYHWDFGDGATATGPTQTHSYSQSGNYTVTLTVTDPQGGEGLAISEFSALNSLGQRAPDTTSGLAPGLFYEYYSGMPNSSFPDFNRMTPASSGVIPSVHYRPRNADLDYAFRFSGYLYVPEDGTYTFHYKARDTLLLRIGSTDVINETIRSFNLPHEGSSSIALQAGYHSLVIGHHYYENVWSDWFSILDLRWETPNSPGNIKGIPYESYYHIPARPTSDFRVSPAPRHHVVPTSVNFLPPVNPGILTFYAPSEGEALDLNFNASSAYSPEGDIVTYLWEFTGGNTATGRKITYSLEPGEHAVSLAVIDALGGRATSGATLRILNPPERLNRARESGASPMAQGDSGIGPAANAFNGDFTDRWLVWAEESYMELHFMHDGARQAFLIDEYTITNPRAWNDRDPLNVRFLGSTDGLNWVLLDEQLSLDWDGQTSFTKHFPLAVNTAYSAFRWEIEPTAESPQGWIVEVPELQIFDGGSEALLVNRPPTAHFNTSTLTPITGEAVTFDASASFDPDQYALTFFWDFGDGLTAHTRSPVIQHNYYDAGHHEVRLTVRDGLGAHAQHTLSLNVEQNLLGAPVAAFSISPDRLDQSGTISFDASASHDPSGGSLQYLWEFGDTAKGEGQQVEHVYPSGIFTASLTVINEQGLRSVASRLIEVLPAALPNSISINFSAGDVTIDPSEYAGFVPARNWNTIPQGGDSHSNLQDVQGTPTSAAISINTNARYGLDGALEAANARLLGAQPGSFTNATLITELSGIPYSQYDIYIYWAGISADRTTGVMAINDGQETRYLRDDNHVFDGVLSESTATSANTAIDGHEFVVFRNRIGSSLSLTTTGPAARTGPAAIQIVDRSDALDAPVALFSTTPASGTAPILIELDASASFGPDTIVEYQWDWDSDGTIDTTSPTPITSHTFNSGGTWAISLTVVDSIARTDTVTRQVSLSSPPTAPVAAITTDFTTGEAPFTVNFSGANSYDQSGGAIISWNWDWNNDGNPDASGVTAAHTFPAGNHTVRLTVENENGETASTTALITSTAPLDSTIISINFGSTQMDVEDVAGVEAAARWNNVTTAGANGLIDGAGITTNTNLEAFSGSGYSTGDDASLGADHRMMKSYVGTLSTEMSLQINHLPNSFAENGYDVIVYFGGSREETFSPKYVIGELSFVLKDDTTTWSGNHSRSTATTTATATVGHSYVRFENLSSSGFSLLIDRNSGAQRYGISGLQVVRKPSPPADPYQKWLTDAGLSEEASTAQSASYMNDGVPNLLKYAMGLDPTTRVPAEYLPQLVQVDDNGTLYPGLALRLNPQSANLTWAVQQSSDLIQWDAVSTEFATPLDHADGSRTWHIRGNQPIHQGSVFLRITLSYTP